VRNRLSAWAEMTRLHLDYALHSRGCLVEVGGAGALGTVMVLMAGG
jgi:hypothetical protein